MENIFAFNIYTKITLSPLNTNRKNKFPKKNNKNSVNENEPFNRKKLELSLILLSGKK